jgi:hypothetical protein
MSGNNNDRTENHHATPRDETYDNFPIEGKSDSDVEWIGMPAASQGGAPLLYEEHTNQVYETELDEDDGVVVPTNPEPLGDESLGDYINDIGQEHGWETLSEFAQNHLGADEHEYEHDTERGRNE